MGRMENKNARYTPNPSTLKDNVANNNDPQPRRRKEGNILFNNALNTFYLRLYDEKNHSDIERGNPLPPHRLLFPISSKGSFICIIPQTG